MGQKVKNTNPYIVGIDLGSNSVGYAAVQTNGWEELESPEKFGIFLLGSHIFEEAGEDDKGKRTLKNQERRRHRLARRTQRRRKARRDALYRIFAQLGWLPENAKERNKLLTAHTDNGKESQPWILRSRALDEQISLTELAKSLCHLNRCRGYQSTRDLMADGIPDEYRQQSKYAEEVEEEEVSQNDEEKLGEVLGGIKGSYTQIFEKKRARTYGELMAKEMAEGRYTRHYKKRFENKELEVKRLHFRSDRALIRQEFNRIWDRQVPFYPGVLTKELKKKIEHIIFYQRELKGTEDLRKTCCVYPTEYTSPKTSDAFQRDRILNDLLNNITVGKKSKKEEENGVRKTLSTEQLNALLIPLMDGFDVELEKLYEVTGTTEKEISIPKTSKIYKSGKVFGNVTRKLIREITQGSYDSWSDDDKNKVVDIINSAPWPKDAYAGLMRLGLLTEKQAAEIALAPFPEGYHSKHSSRFLKRINTEQIETGERKETAELRIMSEVQANRIKYTTEEEQASEVEGKGLIKLPKDLGLRNPIVERSIRRTVWVLNQIIFRYGIPEKIRVELPRDLTMSAKHKQELDKRITENEKNRNIWKKELSEAGLPINYSNLKKLQLLKENNFTLLYEGKQASIKDIPDLQIDHAYPRSKLYINDNRNLVVCLASTNSDKGDTPIWEWMSPDQFSTFRTRVKASKMGRSKKEWLCRDTPPDDEWLGAQLAATGYIARELTKLLRDYGVNVEVSNGKITAHLRQQWGIDNLFPDWLGFAKELEAKAKNKEYIADKSGKNRSDHRHHAIDALTVALTDVRTMQAMSRAHRDRKEGERPDYFKACPIKNLRGYLIEHKDRIVVTHHTLKKYTGSLNTATAQKDDLKALPENLRIGPANGSKIANGKLIRYNQEGKASQCYKLSNNHHLVVYRSKLLNKKGEFDYTAEAVPMIEVSRRWRKKEPIYQENQEILSKGFEKWLVLEKGTMVEFSDAPGILYKLSSLSLDPAIYLRFQRLSVATMNQWLQNRTELGTPIRSLQSFPKFGMVVKTVQLNAFGEIVDETKLQ